MRRLIIKKMSRYVDTLSQTCRHSRVTLFRGQNQRNRTLVEMARTMLIESNLPRKFWTEVVNTSCYIVNRVMVRFSSRKTSYEIFKGKKHSLAHFKVFGTKYFIHINDKKILINLKKKVNQEFFLVIMKLLELTGYII